MTPNSNRRRKQQNVCDTNRQRKGDVAVGRRSQTSHATFMFQCLAQHCILLIETITIHTYYIHKDCFFFFFRLNLDLSVFTFPFIRRTLRKLYLKSCSYDDDDDNNDDIHFGFSEIAITDYC